MSYAQIGAWGANAVSRVQGLAEQLRTLSPDVLIAIAAYCSLVAFLGLVGWSYTSARRRDLTQALLELERQRAELQAMYDTEVKWRTAADRYDEARSAKT